MSFIQQIQLTPQKNLLTDVENRKIYTLDKCELNVFETYRTSELVQLTFHDLVITSMVRGKKVMHLPTNPSFEYVPGETVLAPAGTKMAIDFPEAEEQNPTQCIALTIDRESVSKTVNYLNHNFPREGTNASWDINFRFTHLKNSSVLADVINKMVNICSEQNLTKDILADLTMKELVVRLVQLQNLYEIHDHIPPTSSAFGFLSQFIKENLHNRIDVDTLSRKVYMSRPNFFRHFKREYGISPTQYIISERLKMAKVLIAGTKMSIQQICIETGFEDTNNFIKLFKKSEGVTPGMYRNKLAS
ncbi:AraC family transcriptional regulator [Flavipsychrobacter stenotrophus]|uniref:AraC family transcriptional regulator n=1 Tax=Flavipsychrobacter stenotrophus TaxID=2077091 RepID=A0A2S7T223_9BACT|nr:AraC family transcriptional regulator [Flavipsychrobacter stenotrophus]PQJ12978.1 AraC family transcriptional regulator [Flavipsychrobacter stenotrophus]